MPKDPKVKLQPSLERLQVAAEYIEQFQPELLESLGQLSVDGATENELALVGKIAGASRKILGLAETTLDMSMAVKTRPTEVTLPASEELPMPAPVEVPTILKPAGKENDVDVEPTVLGEIESDILAYARNTYFFSVMQLRRAIPSIRDLSKDEYDKFKLRFPKIREKIITYLAEQDIIADWVPDGVAKGRRYALQVKSEKGVELKNRMDVPDSAVVTRPIAKKNDEVPQPGKSASVFVGAVSKQKKAVGVQAKQTLSTTPLPVVVERPVSANGSRESSGVEFSRFAAAKFQGGLARYIESLLTHTVGGVRMSNLTDQFAELLGVGPTEAVRAANNAISSSHQLRKYTYEGTSFVDFNDGTNYGDGSDLLRSARAEKILRSEDIGALRVLFTALSKLEHANLNKGINLGALFNTNAGEFHRLRITPEDFNRLACLAELAKTLEIKYFLGADPADVTVLEGRHATVSKGQHDMLTKDASEGLRRVVLYQAIVLRELKSAKV